MWRVGWYTDTELSAQFFYILGTVLKSQVYRFEYIQNIFEQNF